MCPCVSARSRARARVCVCACVCVCVCVFASWARSVRNCILMSVTRHRGHENSQCLHHLMAPYTRAVYTLHVTRARADSAQRDVTARHVLLCLFVFVLFSILLLLDVVVVSKWICLFGLVFFGNESSP